MLWHLEEPGNFWFSPLTSKGRYRVFCFSSWSRVAKERVFKAEIFLLTTHQVAEILETLRASQSPWEYERRHKPMRCLCLDKKQYSGF